MLDVARPAFLLAGAALAIIPLVLHLIARHPPERTAFPTFRFLRPDARRSIRLRRVPSDLLLLALRVLLLALLAIGFAGLSWLPARSGTSRIVVLEQSVTPAAWREGVETARRLLLDGGGEPRGALVLFDSSAVSLPPDRITPETFDSLARAGPGTVPPDYAAALRAIPRIAGGLAGADSIRVTLLSDLGYDGWRPGLAAVRRAAWPGRIELRPLPSSPDTAADVSTGESRRAVVLAGEERGGFVSAALEAAGWQVDRITPAGPLPPGSATAYLVLDTPTVIVADTLIEWVRAGASLVVELDRGYGAFEGLLPGRAPATARPMGRGALTFGADLVLDGAERAAAVSPVEADVVAAWENGRPAIAAVRHGRGCVVIVGFDLEGGQLPTSVGYPIALDRTAAACAPWRGTHVAAGGTVQGPLDSGARAVLRGDDLPPEVAAASLAGAAGGGVDLRRWVLGAALLIALVEAFLMYRHGRNS